ncbi:hypothetical protein N7493_008902 [Penicillium malachiteum]|uniref:aldehyde dehydrogenase (NAD(+)) n=1 Tax=Penicillium malachiteum TaxID=1324776 RepID=A0AAD6HFW6_9EURO|nr:hypothetical protein N7493_008902 [Penicillium malachiteum]
MTSNHSISVPSYPPLLTTRWSCKNTSQIFAVNNLATGEIITTVQAGDRNSVHEAVLSAHKAFETDWRWRSPAERSALLFACAAALESHKEELAALLCHENGKPYLDALSGDVSFVIGVFRYFASLVDKLPSTHMDMGTTVASVYHEPYEVCAGIVPFNWPLIHAGGKTAPAIAAGNTIILKPAEQAPLTLLRIVDIINEVLPPDVVQVVPGLGPEVPQALVAHPLVKMVSFTGSSPVGAQVSAAAGKAVKPVVLELGEKNAFVVFDDADIERALRASISGAFFNKGEAGTATSRFLVQRSRFGQAVSRLRCGNGMDASTHVGPQVSKTHQERILSYITIAQTDPVVRVIAQGTLPSDPSCQDGYFVPPTLIADVPRKHVLAVEEIFGPVATVTPFDTETEAIDIVNSSKYGLTTCVVSRDHEKCLRFARRVDVGIVFINSYTRSVLGTPFGGTKDSGNGREHCRDTPSMGQTEGRQGAVGDGRIARMEGHAGCI